MTLVEALRERQAVLGLTTGEFADRLGISRSMWSLTRRGLRRPGHLLLQGVMRQFPELASLCLVYIRDEPAFLLPANVTEGHVDVVTDGEAVTV